MKCIFIYVQFFWYGKLEIHSLLEGLASAHKSECGIGMGAGSAGERRSPSMEAHQAAGRETRDMRAATSQRWGIRSNWFFFFWFKYYLKREEGKGGKGTKKSY
ncbi:unnamed protein product [Rangifer tarandus platyrhynchus]|uniref:Uncharacterized protein n=2 Tax=Rangifer tarandus platyrhynchus TaxID=3082113 RepID=A0ABN8YVD5_RANTA|nr:unnamed protein product [Rangifer tarandus platyrhynchus]CAI9702532.1 unnamed protein product [Rangifer tarandus platyrhynchus]